MSGVEPPVAAKKKFKNDFSPEAKAKRAASTRRYRLAHLPQMAEQQRVRRATHPGEASEINKRTRAKPWGDAGLTNGHKYSIARKRGGMSLYQEMFAKQDGLCGICGLPEVSGRYKTLTVDHCHKTEKIRGLLCNKCNRGLGLFGDDPAVLVAAAEYLNNGGVI